MAEFTSSFAKKISDIFKTSYIALITPSGYEISASDYKRASFGWPNMFSDSNYIYIENSEPVEFNTAESSWGQINKVGIYDKITGGNCILRLNLEEEITIIAGTKYTIPTGRIHVMFLRNSNNI